ICLSYLGPITWETMSEADRKASMEEYFAYDEELQRNGNKIGGEALQGAQTGATLRWKDGKVSVTDGPYAETKEQLAGYFMIEADDLNHAIQLMSRHPVVRGGPVEIRGIEDLGEMIRASE